MFRFLVASCQADDIGYGECETQILLTFDPTSRKWNADRVTGILQPKKRLEAVHSSQQQRSANGKYQLNDENHDHNRLELSRFKTRYPLTNDKLSLNNIYIRSIRYSATFEIWFH